MSEIPLSEEQVVECQPPNPVDIPVEASEESLSPPVEESDLSTADELAPSPPVSDVSPDVSTPSDGFLFEIGALRDQIERLVEEVQFSAKFSEKKQEQIDKLYEENRQYKEDLIEQFKTKLVLGVIEQLDRTDREVEGFMNKKDSEKGYKNLTKSFCDLAGEFRDMLQNRLDITAFQSNIGDKFDAQKHKALATTPDDDEAKDKTIAKSKRHGYMNAKGKILRPEFVEVYYYAPSPKPESSPDVLPSQPVQQENSVENLGDESIASDSSEQV